MTVEGVVGSRLRMRIPILLASLGLACSGAPEHRTTTQSIFEGAESVVLEQRDDHVIADVSQTLLWRGNLVVVDGREANVKVYDLASGDLLSVIGGLGGGPGEFVRPQSAAVLPDDRLAVLDLASARLSFFRPDGSYDGSWATHGIIPTGGLGVSRAGTLLLAGEAVPDTGALAGRAVHEFSTDGSRMRSFVDAPVATHFGEPSMNGLILTVLADAVVTISPVSDRVRIENMESGAVMFASAGGEFYRPVDWESAPTHGLDDPTEWLKDQLLAWKLVALGESHFGVGFESFDRERDVWTFRWAVLSRDGEAVLYSEPTEAMLGPLHDGILYGVAIRSDGRSEILRTDAAFLTSAAAAP